VTNFGEPLRPARTEEAGDDEPLAEARLIAASRGGVRIVRIYAPNGPVVDSIFYAAKLAWFDRLSRWLETATRLDEPLVVGGDLNVAPADIDVWDPAAGHGGTHVSEPERKAFTRLLEWGFVDIYDSDDP
jgi:exodeoxyribonuclease III